MDLESPSSLLNDESIKIIDPKILFNLYIAGGLTQSPANTSNSPLLLTFHP
jgi:hypothetical protein